MKAYRNNWYYIGGIIFAILAFVLGLFGDMIDPMRRIMMVLYMCLLAHQFEEYAVPGGFPYVFPERDTKGFSIKNKIARIRR